MAVDHGRVMQLGGAAERHWAGHRHGLWERPACRQAQGLGTPSLLTRATERRRSITLVAQAAATSAGMPTPRPTPRPMARALLPPLSSGEGSSLCASSVPGRVACWICCVMVPAAVAAWNCSVLRVPLARACTWSTSSVWATCAREVGARRGGEAGCVSALAWRRAHARGHEQAALAC